MPRSSTGIVVFLATDAPGLAAPIVERGHGRVEDQAGGRLLAAFASVADALEAAVEVVQASSAQARVSVHVGEPYREDGAWSGPAVDTVRALCGSGPPGEVHTTPLVALLAGPLKRFTFTSALEVDRDGRGRTTTVLAVDWTPASAATIPFPGSLTAEGLPFGGRGREMAALGAAFERARAFGWRLMLVAGEPGVGKTRLVAEFGRTVHRDGAVVLHGRCDEVPLGPYQPFVEALRHYAAHADLADLAASLGEQAPLLSRLIPDLAEPELQDRSAADDGLARYLLFEAMAGVLVQAAADTPLLLVLDDLHWADEPTLVLLRHLLQRAAPAPVLVVGTYRDNLVRDRSTLADALADLRRIDGVERIALGGLSRDDVVAICRTRAGHELAGEMGALVDRLAQRTEGNPLFLTHSLRHLTELGTLRFVEGRWELVGPAVDVGLPEGVRAMMGQRVARLSDGGQRVLAAASVLGPEFPIGVLEGVGGVGGDELLDVVDEALRARVLVEQGGGDRLAFGHALIREVLYDELSLSRRQRVHQRAAAAWRRAGGEPAEVAHHLLAAVPTVPAIEAAEGVVEAARAAIEQTGYEITIDLCGRGLSTLGLAESDPRRIDLLAVRAQAATAIGQLDQGRADTGEAARRALDAGDVERAVEALVQWCGFAPEVGMDERHIVELTDRALAMLPPDAEVLRARLLGARTWRRLADPDPEAVEAECVEAYELARRTGDREALLHATIAYRVVSDRRPLSERRDDILAAIEEATANYEERMVRAIGRRHVMTLAAERGDRTRFERARADFEDKAKTAHWPMGMAVALRGRGSHALRRGDLAEAEALAGQAAALAPFAVRSQALHLFAVYAEQGRLAEVEPEITGFAARQPDIGAWRAAQAFLFAELGRLSEARSVLAGLIADAGTHLDHPGVAATTLAVLPEAVATVDDPALAAPLYPQLRRWCGQQLIVLDFLCFGSADRRAGLLAMTLGKFDDAVTHLEAAITLDDAFGSPLWAAHGRSALARALRRRAGAGDGERAAKLASEASVVAEHSGSRRLARALSALG
ncbi:MAG: ATP-binding protein [Acidimicrobiales bacterium]